MKRQNRENLQRALGIVEGVAGDDVNAALGPSITLIQAVLDDETPGGGITKPVKLKVKRSVNAPLIKTVALCRSCVFDTPHCRRNCRNCPQKLSFFKGSCRCLKIKFGERCPYYCKDETKINENKEKKL